MASQSYDTIQQTQTIADTAGAWSQTLDFSQFDPSLGSLFNINVGLAGDVAGSVSIENLEAAPAAFTVALPSLISVSGPANRVLATAQPDALASVSLGAFDGTLDYAGASGATLGGLSDTQTLGAVLHGGTSGTDPFVGSGTVGLPVTASTSLEATGPANMQIQSNASAGAAVTLDYSYGTPATPSQYGDWGVVAYSFTMSVDPIDAMTVDSLTTPAQTFSFADSTTGWTNVVAAQQFDPSLGNLEQVNITLSSDIQASVAAENLDPTAGSIATTQTATVTLDFPGSSQTLSTDASVDTYTTLAAYDGSTDFAGTSGFTDQGPSLQADSGTASSDTIDDLAAYVGQGTIDLPIVSSSTATLDGPGNLLAQLLAQGGATVTVSYTYQPVPIVSNAGDTASFVPGTTIVADPGISVSDAGPAFLTGATVAITGGFLAGDWLAADTGDIGISASYDPSDGTLTLSGVDTVWAYQQALSSVAFYSDIIDASAGGSDTTRTLTWSVSGDFGVTSAPVTSTIAVQTITPFTSSATQDVAITQAGTYTVAALESAHSVVLDSPGATLVLEAPLDVAAGFTLEAGTLAFDGGTLSAGSVDLTGGVVSGNTVDIVAGNNFTAAGGSASTPVTVTNTGNGNLAGGSIVTAGSLSILGVFVAPTTGFELDDVGTEGVVFLDAMVAVQPVPVIIATPVVAAVPDITFATITPISSVPVTPAFVPSPDSGIFLLPALASHPVAPPVVMPPTSPVSAAPPSGGTLVTAESLGLDPAVLAAASGAGPGAPDVWQIMTQTDISGTGGALAILLNPVDHTWVGLTLQQAGALNTGVVTDGGPVASLAAFLSNEQTHPG